MTHQNKRVIVSFNEETQKFVAFDRVLGIHMDARSYKDALDSLIFATEWMFGTLNLEDYRTNGEW